VSRLLVFSLAVLISGFAYGKEAAPAAADPALEKRVMDLANELRCLVCQNQTLADSHAPLAVDLRNQIREQLKRGASERDVADFMVARYGDFVLYRPPLKAGTLVLWFGPFLLLAIGVFFLLKRIRKQGAQPQPQLSDAERARAARLLDGQ
jgi:cytochrome c-type biogenesis protein CcmH